jgi:hypothetical protein
MSDNQSTQSEQQQQRSQRPRVPKVVLEVAYDPVGPQGKGYRGAMTGHQGKTIKLITEKTGTQITFQDENRDRGDQCHRAVIFAEVRNNDYRTAYDAASSARQWLKRVLGNTHKLETGQTPDHGHEESSE